MGDKATLSKARRELEDLYLGVPDDSVNLTFQDLAEVRQKQQHSISPDKRKSILIEPISETSTKREESSPLTKLPSLDFSRSIEASKHSNHTNMHYPNSHHEHNHHLHDHPTDHAYDPSRSHLHHNLDENILRGHAYGHRETHHGHSDHHHAHVHGGGHYPDHHARHAELRHGVETSMAFSDISHMSGMSMASVHHQRGGRRRPGIPHSNICTICSTYIYVFRHRCLVCGRVYCRQCVRIGMGEMTEGRKCIDCLGRRFSQRYIQKAGQVGRCMGYPSKVKKQELIWAEKGPRRSGENRYGRSSMTPRPRSPMTPRSPTGAQSASNAPSFVMNSPYSPYSSTSYPMPL